MTRKTKAGAAATAAATRPAMTTRRLKPGQHHHQQTGGREQDGGAEVRLFQHQDHRHGDHAQPGSAASRTSLRLLAERPW